jgi:hypothetical protein
MALVFLERKAAMAVTNDKGILCEAYEWKAKAVCCHHVARLRVTKEAEFSASRSTYNLIPCV